MNELLNEFIGKIAAAVKNGDAVRRELTEQLTEVYNAELKHTDENGAAKYAVKLLGEPAELAAALDKKTRNHVGYPAIITAAAILVVCAVISAITGLFAELSVKNYVFVVALAVAAAAAYCVVYARGFKLRDVINGLMLGSVASGVGYAAFRVVYYYAYLRVRRGSLGQLTLIDVAKPVTAIPVLAVGAALFLLVMLVRLPVVKPVAEREVIEKMIFKAQKRSMF
ncbi:MAG: hypothetical protein LBN00_11950 [Oscillospiraceae bacterium]|jgi:hypothetical protein|nr:hypothetical protein [Oscillospiraceae bacterium]